MEARYLMLDPRSYDLEHGQLFKIQQCQFCGHHEFNYQRYINPKSEIGWVQRCKECKKTVSSVKKYSYTK